MKKKILTVMASVALLSAGSMMATNSTQVSAKTTKAEKVSSMPDVRYISCDFGENITHDLGTSIEREDLP